MPRMLSAEEVALFAAVPGQDTLPGFSSAAEVLTRPVGRQAQCAELFSVEELGATENEVWP